MKLYRVTKNKSKVYLPGEEIPWNVEAHEDSKKDVLALSGVDLRGPGRWFTSDPKELSFYVRYNAGRNYVVTWVDVPDDIVEEFSTYNIQHGLTKNPPHISAKMLNSVVFNTGGISGLKTEYYLPLEWAEKARILCMADDLAKANYDVSVFTEHVRLLDLNRNNKRENKLNFVRLLEQTPVEQLIWRVLHKASSCSNTSPDATSKHKVPPTEELYQLLIRFINEYPDSERKLRKELEGFYRINPNDVYEIFRDIEASLRIIDM